MADRTYLLKIAADVSDAQRSIGSMESSANTFKTRAKQIGTAIGTAFAVDKVAQFGKAAITAASDAEQAAGASQSVFGQYADDIEAFSQTTAKELGIARGEFLQMSSVTGSLMKNAGVPMDQVAESSKALTERAADMAAMFGGTVPDAMGAINSAMKGEFDPLENFGVSLKASTINAYAMAEGYTDASGEVTDAGRAIAAQELIMKQSADAAGTFAAESDTLAGQQAIMKAQFADLQAEIGTKLLPVMTKIMGVVMQFVEFVQRNQGWLLPLIAGIGALVLGIKAWTLAQAALNLVMSLNPIGLVIIAIGALVAAFVVLWNKSEAFREFWRSLWEGIQRVVAGFVDVFTWYWSTLFDIYTFPFKQGWKIVSWLFEQLRNAIGYIPKYLGIAWNGLVDIITWPFRTAVDSVVWAFDRVRETIGNIPGWINTAWNGLVDIITWPFRTAIDGIKWLWNSTVGGFGFEIPGWVPGVGGKSWKIPELAAGGIVNRPTVALIGEAGPEAVVPLDGKHGFGGSTTIVNVYSLVPTAETGRLVARALDEHARVSGRRTA